MYRNSATKEDLCADIESNKISLIKTLFCHYCRNQQVIMRVLKYKDENNLFQPITAGNYLTNKQK